jgi:hypothetical protein
VLDPPVELPPVEPPPFELPPFELPPFELPPFELPPFELPPFELPPFELPPFELPPFELPPVPLTPTQAQRSPDSHRPSRSPSTSAQTRGERQSSLLVQPDPPSSSSPSSPTVKHPTTQSGAARTNQRKATKPSLDISVPPRAARTQ